jgi:hypothetical protein
MLTGNGSITATNRGRIAMYCLRAFIICGLLGFVTAVPAFSQMGSYSIYSDTWADDSNPSQIKVYGCGVSQDNYNSYGHTYWATTTITSPSGRTTSATSYKTNSYNAYTRADVSLDWQNEFGDFTTNSNHTGCCPYMGGNPYTGQNCYLGGSTSVTLTVGASVTVLTKAAMSNIYTKVANCNVICPVDQYEASQDYGQYIAGVTPFFYFYGYQCSVVAAFYHATVATPCGDYSVNVPIPGLPL